jgi:hypothetical protein
MTSITVVEFDFENRRERTIPMEEARAACDKGLCCWIDVDLGDGRIAEKALRQMGVNDVAIEEALTPPARRPL